MRPGTISPMHSGPSTRIPDWRAASSMRWRIEALPSRASSRWEPPESTRAARTPMLPSRAMRPGTVATGEQMTARSGASGSWPMRAKAGWPKTLSYPLGFTAQMVPGKPASCRLRITNPPRELAFSEAPITAMVRGSKK